MRRRQIWRDECTAVDFTQLLHVAPLQTLRTKVTVYDDTVIVVVVCVERGRYVNLGISRNLR